MNWRFWHRTPPPRTPNQSETPEPTGGPPPNLHRFSRNELGIAVTYAFMRAVARPKMSYQEVNAEALAAVEQYRKDINRRRRKNRPEKKTEVAADV